jgi:2-keto-4-pentenoate hydratase/2-oxohepta-3-ene-1,7-dioic acid hydratase in catechol pathway
VSGVWQLVTYRDGAEAGDRAGLLLADGRIVSHPLLDGYAGLMALMPNWGSLEPALRELDLELATPRPSARLLAPLRYPRKVICAGVNFRGHVKEMLKIEAVPPGFEPFFFLKPPTTTVIGPGDAIPVPADGSAKVDWEVELVAVISRGGRDIAESAALGHVAAYTVGNDVSARGLFFRENPPSPAFRADWVRHKAMDCSMPLGPGLVPHWMIADPQQLAMRLTVNGTVKQDSSTADMILGVAALVAAASRAMTLEPGDVIATGTPAGVGIARGEALKPGDLMVTEISGIGRLENPITTRS